MGKVARLLDEIVPTKYNLDLDIDMKQFSVKGQEKIAFDLKRGSNKLTFHAVGLSVTGAVIDGQAAKSTEASEEDQTLTFIFTDDVIAGSHILSFDFVGPISESLHGFYRSNYTKDGKESWLAATQFEAVHAREAFVCIDEPSAKAIFELSLNIPESMTALGNTNVVSESVDYGKKKVQFAPTPKMSTYLIAYAVGDFEFIEQKTPDGVLVRTYATPGQAEQLKFALDAAVRTLTYFNEYFGVPYPLPKLDMIAIPDFSAGAMENWGLITYRETALLLDPDKTSLSHKQRVAEVVAHELAHMWFGDLVTMAWWDDLWLNEGFATWVASLAMSHLWPEWEIWTQFIDEEFAQAQEMDSLANTHPIQVEVDDPRALDEIFDAISYAKGASVLNMLHHYLGADDFKRGLHNYLEEHKFGNSVTNDLWKSLEAASKKPVTKVMGEWTSRPGYPLVTFDEGDAKQSRFFSSPKEAAKASESDGKPWPIPFNVIVAPGRETDQELIDSKAVPLPAEVMAADWFKPNPGQTSFYRALYTAPMIQSLSGPMSSGLLSPTDRYGIVSDVFATTEAGVTNSEVALALTEAMREESDYVVWGGLTGGFGCLGAIVEDESLRDRLDRFGRWLVSPNVARLGWEPRANESSFDTLMRPSVLQQAVRFDDEAVTAEARARFDKYIEGGPIDSELRPVALFAAARHGGEKEFDAILARYRTEESPQVKISLLSALGRFRDRNMIQRFLDLGLSEDVRPQDIYIVLAWGFRNREGRELTWNWLKSNWDTFIERYGAGGHMLERFPIYAGMGFASHEKAHEIGEFFASHPHPATKRPTAQAVEGVELKADWYTRDKQSVENFLAKWEAKHK